MTIILTNYQSCCKLKISKTIKINKVILISAGIEDSEIHLSDSTLMLGPTGLIEVCFCPHWCPSTNYKVLKKNFNFFKVNYYVFDNLKILQIFKLEFERYLNLILKVIKITLEKLSLLPCQILFVALKIEYLSKSGKNIIKKIKHWILICVYF